MSLLDLSRDILNIIFDLLVDTQDLCSIAQTNSILYEFVRYDLLAERMWNKKVKSLMNLTLSSYSKVTSNITRFKVLIIGDGGTGKSSFCKKWLGHQDSKRYVATMGVEVMSIPFMVNGDIVLLDLWDTAGPEKFGGLRDGYYIGGHAAIILFDVTSRLTYKNVPTWIRDTRRVCNDIPIVVVGNKIDNIAAHKKFNLRMLNKKNVPCFPVSVHCNYNIEKPFMKIFNSLYDSVEYCECLFKVASPSKTFEVHNYNELGLFHVTNEDDDSDSAMIIDIRHFNIEPVEECNFLLSNKRRVKKLNNTYLAYQIKNWSERLCKGILPLLKGQRCPVIGEPYQNPTWFIVPGLTAKPFHPPKTIPTETFENIKKEYQEAKMNTNCIVETISSSTTGNWKAIYLVKEGVRQKTTLFENTINFLSSFTYQSTKLITDCSIGYAYFSTIEPKTHILPHCGPCNLKLRVHLPISLPQDEQACWISVGNERKNWNEGELLVFDDSFVHEVKNDSSEERVVLVFDIWHPDLLQSEIGHLQQFPL